MAEQPLELFLRRIYRRWLAPIFSTDLGRQRLKLFTYYAPAQLMMLGAAGLSIRVRIRLWLAFMRIDWNVLHAHFPYEMAALTRALTERPAAADEIVIEAGCWQGGSTAKLSLLCAHQGYRLHVYDSFQGVEAMVPEPGEWDFTGEYAAPLNVVQRHVAAYGRPDVCTYHPGWFAETFARPVAGPVRLVYIDCDLAKGTEEVLRGVLPAMAADGYVFSQDFHIASVRRVLEAAPLSPPHRHGTYLASFRPVRSP